MDKVYGSKNILLEFMDLSDTNYKFIDPKMQFQSLWTYVFKVYGPNWHKLQVDGPKNALLEFLDQNGTPLKVGVVVKRRRLGVQAPKPSGRRPA